MELIKIFLMSAVWMVMTSSLMAQSDTPSTSQQVTTVDKIEVYYFHFTRRCATCQAVEDESKNSLEELYPAQVEGGKIVFLVVNLEENSNKLLAEKLQVSGQTLLITKGDKKFDITNDGFKYARTNPEKLQETIKNIIDPLL